MNKKTKVIKFKKVDKNINPAHNYVGFYQQNTQNIKELSLNHLQNKPVVIKPQVIDKVEINEKEEQKEPVFKGQQYQAKHQQSSFKNQQSNKKFQAQCYLSDNQQFPLSEIKKKTQPIKLAYPKGYKIQEPIQQLRIQIIDGLSKTQPIISIEEIFSVPLMRNILGVFQQGQKQINFVCKEETKKDIYNDYQQSPQKHQQQQQQVYRTYNNHDAQIFNAIQMQEEEQQNNNWNPHHQQQQQHYWNDYRQTQHQHYQIHQNRTSLQNNPHFNFNQRNNHFNGNQFFLPAQQNNFFSQMDFQTYPMDFDM